ncbi:LSU ribosomal protein L4p (L1e) [Thioalkalivibrio nitratireducens DSM 14787]|uniref:Large ribosomal subunit protein uL4 n=1 Tax=Thioalkalivibrio nitratireducens (strain DSM 14787 / UNIQEM 213 / ALEN2) TaxID=1255043 RepID=L0DX86_THIND|nr:50S ribosomal protein L4 [Thioalkalivibrio nitratireducens]AGA34214.1 LSU ribosomal protein L4p (L1e) [Thioalkalivibrio nitratireducens DSM 14787]
MQVITADTATAVELSAACFEREFNESLVHQSVVAQLAGARAGTRAQKGRTEVSGGGIKPFRQKGTGRARAGTIRSPLWRGGGKVFAASTRDFSQKLNRKMYRAAMASILSELLRQERLKLVESFRVDSGKTRDAAAALRALALESGLVVVGERHGPTWLALRNIPNIDVVTAAELNPVRLVGAEVVVMTADAAKRVEEWLA